MGEGFLKGVVNRQIDDERWSVVGRVNNGGSVIRCYIF